MSAIPAVVIGSAPVRPAAHEAAESDFATRTRAFTPTACACRPSRNANSNDDPIGYRLSAIGYWLWYRASRPPEMRRDVLSQSGGHGAGVFKENDRPVPGLPWASQTVPAPLPVVGGHPPTPGAAHTRGPWSAMGHGPHAVRKTPPEPDCILRTL